MAISLPTQRRFSSEPGETPRDLAYEYRRIVGNWLREHRERVNLTQRDVAETLGLLGNTHVSAVEFGRSSLPPEHFEEMADLYGIDRQEFAQVMLRYSNPWIYLMLIEDDPKVRKEIGKAPARTGAIIRKRKKG